MNFTIQKFRNFMNNHKQSSLFYSLGEIVFCTENGQKAEMDSENEDTGGY